MEKIEYVGEENILQQFLNDSVSTSMVKVSKKDKIQRLSGSKAMTLAKDKNDPLYAKYKKLNDKRNDLKSKIMTKYSSRARKAARETLGKS